VKVLLTGTDAVSTWEFSVESMHLRRFAYWPVSSVHMFRPVFVCELIALETQLLKVFRTDLAFVDSGVAVINHESASCC